MSVRRTPLLKHGPVWLKLENLQLTGSFKVRGATRFLENLKANDREQGLVAASAGNHGAGLAYAARAAGVSVKVFVPEGTPSVKKSRMASLGAELVIAGAIYDEAQAIAKEYAKANGLRFVSPYDDEDVIAGSGDGLADELFEQCPSMKKVLVPVGGGGLIAGLARTLGPKGISVVGVEPGQNCAMYESLEQGVAASQYEGGRTIADGLEGSVCGRTFDYVRVHGDGVALVSEDDMRDAIAYLFSETGQIVEPSGAVGVAAWRNKSVPLAEEGDTVILVTGANIDDEHLDRILSRR